MISWFGLALFATAKVLFFYLSAKTFCRLFSHHSPNNTKKHGLPTVISGRRLIDIKSQYLIYHILLGIEAAAYSCSKQHFSRESRCDRYTFFQREGPQRIYDIWCDYYGLIHFGWHCWQVKDYITKLNIYMCRHKAQPC